MDTTSQNLALYPLWHSTTISKHSCCSCQVDAKFLPDHGGAGVDVHILPYSNGTKALKNVTSCFLKSEVPLTDFASKNCVLPLTGPNLVEKTLDACCEHLRYLQNKQKNYALSMFHIAHGCSKNKKQCYLKLKTELSSKCRSRDEFIIPKRIFELSESKPDILPVPRANWKYSGGCLESVVYSGINDGMPFLIHSGGKQLNDIVVTSVSKNLFSDEKPIVSNQQKFKLENSPIFQIAVQPFDEILMACVRQEQDYHLLCGLINDISTVNLFKMKQKILYCSVSPYILGEHVVLTQSSQLILKNGEMECASWNSLQETSNVNAQDSWQGCDFGSHPRCISYCSCRMLSLIDVRTKRNKCLEIFNASNSFLFPKEELTLSKLNEAQPHQYFVGTNHHMILCDERFTQQPLLVWNHLLDSFPMYCNILQCSEVDNTLKTHILIGTHLPQQVVHFFLMPSTFSQIQPVSCTPPCHLSVPVDIAEYLKLQCITLKEPAIKRLSAPIVGTCSAFYNQCLSVFQLTSFGDLFYQNYMKSNKPSEKTHSVGPGCSFILPFEMSDVDWWIEEIDLDSNSSSSLSSDLALKEIDCSKEFNSFCMLPKPSLNCNFCCKNDSRSMPMENCISCGIHSSEGKHILKAAQLNIVIPQVVSHNSDVNKYSAAIEKEFCYGEMDPMSKSLFDTWFKETMPFELAEQPIKQKDISDETTEFLPKPYPSVKTSCNSVSDIIVSGKDSIETCNEIEDEIPPSQEVSQLLGETIRLSSARKKRSILAADGF